MRLINSSEARTRRYELLRDAMHGEVIGITRHGKLIARLESYGEIHVEAATAAALVSGISKIGG